MLVPMPISPIPPASSAHLPVRWTMTQPNRRPAKHIMNVTSPMADSVTGMLSLNSASVMPTAVASTLAPVEATG